MTTHTAGPWNIGKAYTGESSGVDVHYNGGLVCVVAGGNYGEFRDTDDCGDAEFAANARLIAAAPDLLAALQSSQASVCHLACEHGSTGVDVVHSDLCNDMRAAIAKAKGE